MAASSGVFTTTFLSPETASWFLKSSYSAKPVQISPVNLRTVHTVTLATASPKPVTGKREPRGIMKPRRVSPEMEALVGAPEIPRTQALKLIWAHIKQHNLQVFSVFFLIKFYFFILYFFLFGLLFLDKVLFDLQIMGVYFDLNGNGFASFFFKLYFLMGKKCFW